MSFFVTIGGRRRRHRPRGSLWTHGMTAGWWRNPQLVHHSNTTSWCRQGTRIILGNFKWKGNHLGDVKGQSDSPHSPRFSVIFWARISLNFCSSFDFERTKRSANTLWHSWTHNRSIATGVNTLARLAISTPWITLATSRILLNKILKSLIKITEIQ